jgi:hypothetical protein
MVVGFVHQKVGEGLSRIIKEPLLECPIVEFRTVQTKHSGKKVVNIEEG